MTRLIRGGRVVTATDQFDADVLIDGESIVAVGTGLQGDEEIDASGCLVMPGLIDNHTHLSMPFGGTWSCDDYDTGTAAAAAGGTTCIVDFIIQYVGGSLKDAREEWQGRADGAAHIDYGFHMAITDARPEVVAEMEDCVAEGITSFKVFMAYKGALMVDDEQFLAVLEQTGKTGGLVMVHCENGDAVVRYQKEALERGDTDPKFHASTRPPEVEGEATCRAIRLAEWTGRPLFVVHVTCEEAVKEIQAARDRGLPIFGETCIQYLYLTVDDLDRPDFEGAKYVCSPPLREAYNQHVLYQALRQGALQGISTDHCPFNFKEQKELGLGDFTKIPNGLPAIEHRLTLLYDRTVREGHMSIVDVVRHGSWGPARIFGLDTKGAIAPGFDADIVVFDPEVKHTISAETHVMNVDYDPFEGWEVQGKPRFVLSRGETVYADGKVVSAAGPRALRQALAVRAGAASRYGGIQYSQHYSFAHRLDAVNGGQNVLTATGIAVAVVLMALLTAINFLGVAQARQHQQRRHLVEGRRAGADDHRARDRAACTRATSPPPTASAPSGAEGVLAAVSTERHHLRAARLRAGRPARGREHQPASATSRAR